MFTSLQKLLIPHIIISFIRANLFPEHPLPAITAMPSSGKSLCYFRYSHHGDGQMGHYERKTIGATSPSQLQHKKILVYVPGNFQEAQANIHNHSGCQLIAAQLGEIIGSECDVVVHEYRGCGANYRMNTVFSDYSMHDHAADLIATIRDLLRQGAKLENITLVGLSLGCAVATTALSMAEASWRSKITLIANNGFGRLDKFHKLLNRVGLAATAYDQRLLPERPISQILHELENVYIFRTDGDTEIPYAASLQQAYLEEKPLRLGHTFSLSAAENEPFAHGAQLDSAILPGTYYYTRQKTKAAIKHSSFIKAIVAKKPFNFNIDYQCNLATIIAFHQSQLVAVHYRSNDQEIKAVIQAILNILSAKHFTGPDQVVHAKKIIRLIRAFRGFDLDSTIDPLAIALVNLRDFCYTTLEIAAYNYHMAAMSNQAVAQPDLDIADLSKPETRTYFTWTRVWFYKSIMAACLFGAIFSSLAVKVLFSGFYVLGYSWRALRRGFGAPESQDNIMIKAANSLVEWTLRCPGIVVCVLIAGLSTLVGIGSLCYYRAHNSTSRECFEFAKWQLHNGTHNELYCKGIYLILFAAAGLVLASGAYAIAYLIRAGFRRCQLQMIHPEVSSNTASHTNPPSPPSPCARQTEAGSLFSGSAHARGALPEPETATAFKEFDENQEISKSDSLPDSAFG